MLRCGDFMKLKAIFIICIMTLIMTGPSYVSEGQFNAAEKEYIAQNSDRTYTIGIYPMTGKDYFSYDDKVHGYILEVIAVLADETGLDFDLKIYFSWNGVYESFMNKKVDLILGANKTKEREKEMLFTEPLDQMPYAIFIHEDSDLLTIGDFENKTIGFPASDMIIDRFKNDYTYLTYKEKIFHTQKAGLYGLSAKNIDGFITSGGIMAYQFIYDYENIKLMTQLEGVTSDMTLATLKENRLLMAIVRKVLEKPMAKKRIKAAKDEAELIFNRKVLQLTDEEKAYLKLDDTVKVGVLIDYLPIDYYSNGEFLGVSGKIFNYISQLINIKTEIIVGDFASLYSKAVAGEIDMLLMAKTDEREKIFDFPRPFYNERDIIYGNEASEPINSIYALENQRVAVIESYWHEGYLKKNLRNPKIIITDNIQESLDLLSKGKVDYLMENRLVGEYYRKLYGYDEIQKKGVTSRSSALYYGVRKGNGPLASIIDKSLKLVDYKKMENEGISSIPQSEPIQVKKQRILIFVLILVLISLTFALYKVFMTMVNQKLESKVLKEKQKLMYQDSLTGLKNRTYFDQRVEALKAKENFCFVIIDLDDLKAINDTYGHLVGDELIKMAAMKLKEIFKDFEHIRFGGDEFLLISENKSEETIKKLMSKSEAVAKETEIVFENIAISGFSFGIGFAIRRSLDETINDVFKNADEMMYRNKTNGKQG